MYEIYVNNVYRFSTLDLDKALYKYKVLEKTLGKDCKIELINSNTKEVIKYGINTKTTRGSTKNGL